MWDREGGSKEKDSHITGPSGYLWQFSSCFVMMVAELTAQQVLHPSSCWSHPVVTLLVPHPLPSSSLSLVCLLPHREGREEQFFCCMHGLHFIQQGPNTQPHGSIKKKDSSSLSSFTDSFALDSQPRAWLKEKAILKGTLKLLLWRSVCNEGICETLQIEKCSEILGSSHSRVLVAGPYS